MPYAPSRIDREKLPNFISALMFWSGLGLIWSLRENAKLLEGLL